MSGKFGVVEWAPRPSIQPTDELWEHLIPHLKVGDLILIENKSAIHPVYLCQKLHITGRIKEALHFVHVCLYVGDGEICHSMPTMIPAQRGVRKEKLKILNGKNIVILRYEFPPTIYAYFSIALKAAAERHVGKAYNYFAVLQLAVQTAKSMISLGKGESSTTRITRMEGKKIEEIDEKDYEQISDFICSDFVYDCYSEVLKSTNPLDSMMVSIHRLPAEFYINADLQTVLVLYSEQSESWMISTERLQHRSHNLPFRF